MTTPKLPQTWQVLNQKPLTVLETDTREATDNILDILDSKINFPFRLELSGSTITVKSSEISSSGTDYAGGVVPSFNIATAPIQSQYLSFIESTLDVSNGTETGDFTPAPVSPSMTAGYYIWLGLEAKSDGKINLNWGIEGATLGAATYPVFSSGTAIALIPLKDDGTGGIWNFQNPVKSDIIIFKGSGGGGGGGGIDFVPAYNSATQYRIQNTQGRRVRLNNKYYYSTTDINILYDLSIDQTKYICLDTSKAEGLVNSTYFVDTNILPSSSTFPKHWVVLGQYTVVGGAVLPANVIPVSTREMTSIRGDLIPSEIDLTQFYFRPTYGRKVKINSNYFYLNSELVLPYNTSIAGTWYICFDSSQAVGPITSSHIAFTQISPSALNFNTNYVVLGEYQVLGGLVVANTFVGYSDRELFNASSFSKPDGNFYQFALSQETTYKQFRAEQYFDHTATLDSENLVDTLNSTAVDYSTIGGYYQFDNVDEIVITNVLTGDQFLSEGMPVGEGKVELLYDSTAVDPAPRVDISVDGGTTWTNCNARQIGCKLTNKGLVKTEFNTLGSDTPTPLTNAISGFGQLLAQSFQTTTDVIVSVVKLRMTRVGNPGGYLTLDIRKDNAGVPGSILTSSSSIASSEVSTVAGDITFNFELDTDLIQSGTTYWLVLKADNTYTYTVATNYVGWNLNSSGGYASGKASQYDSSISTWVDYSSGNADFIFGLYGDTIASSYLNGVTGEFSATGLKTYSGLLGGSTQVLTSTGVYAQKFQVNAKYVLNDITVSAKRIGLPTGTFNIGIYTSLGGLPLIETIDFPINSVATTFGNITLPLPTALTLNSSTDYYYVISTNGYTYSAAVTEFNLEYDNTGAFGYNRWTNEGSWVENFGQSYKFILSGYEADLKLRIKSRTANTKLKAFCVQFNEETSFDWSNPTFERHVISATEASSNITYLNLSFTPGNHDLIVFKDGHYYQHNMGFVENQGYLLWDSGIISTGNVLYIHKISNLYADDISEKAIQRSRLDKTIVVGNSIWCDYAPSDLQFAIADCPAGGTIYIADDVSTTGIVVQNKTSRFKIEFAIGVGLIKVGSAMNSRGIEFINCTGGVDIIGGKHQLWNAVGDFVFHFSGTTDKVILDKQVYVTVNNPPTNITSLVNYSEGQKLRY